MNTKLYSINVASKRLGVGYDVLARMIRAGQVDGARYVEPEFGGKRGRWIIPAVPFDRQFGLQEPQDTTETPAEPTPNMSFLKKRAS